MTTTPKPRSPGVAALLSALFPGLGQARLGARRRAIVLALPFVAAIVAGVVLLALDPSHTVGAIVAPAAEMSVLGAIGALAVIHLIAVLDAMRLGRRLVRAHSAERPLLAADAPMPDVAAPARPRRTLPFALFALALAWVVGIYGTIELVGKHAYEAAGLIFADPSAGYQIPAASFAPRPTRTPEPGPTGLVSIPPAPTVAPSQGPAWAADGRLNILLIGSDAGPGRWMARMDSINVLSVDIASGRAALFSIWRYTGNVPLPPESAGAFPDGRFPDWLNALYVYAMEHPKEFPGGDARGFRATAGAVQELIGQQLDGAVEVDLNGFVDLIDAIGGLWIDIPYPVSDPHYAKPDGSGYIQLDFHTGCQKLTGEHALEYARTRHQDSDWQRMRRQQRVITALGRQLDPIEMLPRVPALLDVAGNNLWTTIQPDEIADMAALAARVDRSNVITYSFWPPTTPQRLDTAGIEHVRDIVATIFDDPTAEPSPTPEATLKPCPAHG
ncbi:MAG TPA: LCP family protein [Candidatus Limnocylindrales bacterium]|nr:LCP family protein [Candidatus Limnocylindrales bacterium]